MTNAPTGLARLPRHLPSLAQLLTDLGNPTNEAIAKALGVSVVSVRRWKRTQAPRPAMLALWWLGWDGYLEWDELQRQRYDLARWSLALQRQHLGEERLIRLQALRVVRERPFEPMPRAHALEGAAVDQVHEQFAPRTRRPQA